MSRKKTYLPWIFSLLLVTKAQSEFIFESTLPQAARVAPQVLLSSLHILNLSNEEFTSTQQIPNSNYFLYFLKQPYAAQVVTLSSIYSDILKIPFYENKMAILLSAKSNIESNFVNILSLSGEKNIQAGTPVFNEREALIGFTGENTGENNYSTKFPLFTVDEKSAICYHVLNFALNPDNSANLNRDDSASLKITERSFSSVINGQYLLIQAPLNSTLDPVYKGLNKLVVNNRFANIEWEIQHPSLPYRCIKLAQPIEDKSVTLNSMLKQDFLNTVSNPLTDLLLCSADPKKMDNPQGLKLRLESKLQDNIKSFQSAIKKQAENAGKDEPENENSRKFTKKDDEFEEDEEENYEFNPSNLNAVIQNAKNKDSDLVLAKKYLNQSEYDQYVLLVGNKNGNVLSKKYLDEELRKIPVALDTSENNISLKPMIEIEERSSGLWVNHFAVPGAGVFKKANNKLSLIGQCVENDGMASKIELYDSNLLSWFNGIATTNNLEPYHYRIETKPTENIDNINSLCDYAPFKLVANKFLKILSLVKDNSAVKAYLSQPSTLFIPTDELFGLLKYDFVQNLLDNKDDCGKNFIKEHLFKGCIGQEPFSNEYTNTFGSKITLEKNEGQIILNISGRNVYLESCPIQCGNTYVYLVDKFIMDPKQANYSQQWRIDDPLSVLYASNDNYEKKSLAVIESAKRKINKEDLQITRFFALLKASGMDWALNLPEDKRTLFIPEDKFIESFTLALTGLKDAEIQKSIPKAYVRYMLSLFIAPEKYIYTKQGLGLTSSWKIGAPAKIASLAHRVIGFKSSKTPDFIFSLIGNTQEAGVLSGSEVSVYPLSNGDRNVPIHVLKSGEVPLASGRNSIASHDYGQGFNKLFGWSQNSLTKDFVTSSAVNTLKNIEDNIIKRYNCIIK